MSGLSGGAVEHWTWAAEVLIAFVVGLLSIAGGLVVGFRWLDKRMDERIGNWSESKGFRNAVAEIVAQAFSATAELYNRQLEDIRRQIVELRERDAERLDSVKRAHQRIDGMMGQK